MILFVFDVGLCVFVNMPCCGCWWNGRQRHRPPENESSGNPRNKCALKPGHSLMDWIRLGNSGKDLTGVGGCIRPVALRELATHNTEGDAWLAIRGRVYNITHYLPYHPGGPEELMRGAGIDATQLFDKVHPWVNYDSLLAKCLIGPLSIDRPDASELFGSPSPKSDRLREPSKTQELVRKSMENIANCITPVRRKNTTKTEESKNPSKVMQSLIQSSDLPVTISRQAGTSPVKSRSPDDEPAPLKFDWLQTSGKLTLSIYTWPLSNPGVSASLIDGVLCVETVTQGWLRSLKVVPEAELQEPLQLRVFADSGKIEVIAPKSTPAIWKGCGETTASPATRVTLPRALEATIKCIEQITHDTVLLALAPKTGTVVMPLGYHVRVHCKIDDKDCIRSYTPLGEGWGPKDHKDGTTMKLAVKRYESGAMSPHLTSLALDHTVNLSGPYGNFQLLKLKRVKTLVLITAGTGVTPMLSIIKFMLARSNLRCVALHLLFFNKTENDILFKDHFDSIMNEDKRFVATYILSDADTKWTGLRGRINEALLTQVIEKDTLQCSEECTHFTLVCGPNEFTHTTLGFIKKLGMNDTCLHAFMA